MVVVISLVAASPAGAAQTAPWGTFPATNANSAGSNPYVVIVGDSLTVDPNYSVQPFANHVRSSSGRSTYVSGTPGGQWVTYGWPGQQNGNSLIWELADFLNARITVGALATNDARIMTSSPGSYSQQAQYNVMANAVAQTRQHSSCVLLVNVRERNVAGMTAANASKVNDNMTWLSAVYPGGRVFVADWDAYSKPNPSWFIANDVHMTGAGQLHYYDFITTQTKALIKNKNC